MWRGIKIMYRIWNEIERQFIRDNVEKLSDAEGAQQLSIMTGRKITIHAWRKQRQMMGLKKRQGRGLCEIEGTSSTVRGDVEVTTKRIGEENENATTKSPRHDGNPELQRDNSEGGVAEGEGGVGASEAKQQKCGRGDERGVAGGGIRIFRDC
jgi:hypothetical protein